MELKFHQKTYDLITTTYIDPQKAMDVFDRFEGPVTYKHHVEAHGEEYALQTVKKWRDTVLPWTELNLYQRLVRFSDENIQKLDELEQRHNIQLPTSVREWYSLDIAPEIMSVWDASGYPPIYRNIEEMSPISQETCDIYDVEYRNNLWDFLFADYIEQQGNNFLFEIGTEDDPPVYTLLHGEYRLVEPHFSQFIFLHFWSWLTRYAYTESVFIYPDQLLGPPSMYWLPIQRFEERLSELNFYSGRYFFDDDLRVSAYMPRSSNGSTVNLNLVAGGSFRTTDVKKLRRLFIDLWGENKVPVFYMHSTGDLVSSAVDELQREQLLHLIFSAPSDWVSLEYLVDQLSSPDAIPPNRSMLVAGVKNQLENLSGLIQIDESNTENNKPLLVRYRLLP